MIKTKMGNTIYKLLFLLKVSLVKAIILFRIRVNDTKLPYLWLFLPTLLRVAPFAFIILALSNNEMGLRFIQVALMTAPCSVLLRRVFRIRNMHERLPVWVNKDTLPTLTLFSFSLLTFFESIIPVLVLSYGIFLSTDADFLVWIRFTLISILMLIIGILVVFFCCPAILVAYQKFEDVRHGTRYTFMLLNATLMLCITLNVSSNSILSMLPGMFFINLTALPYQEFRPIQFFGSLVTLLAVVIFLVVKYPLRLINTVQSDDSEDLREQP